MAALYICINSNRPSPRSICFDFGEYVVSFIFCNLVPYPSSTLSAFADLANSFAPLVVVDASPHLLAFRSPSIAVSDDNACPSIGS